MGDKTGIEWTDATWNPIGGCSIKSPGCAPCYAQQLAGTRLAQHPLYAGTTTKVKGKPVFNGHLTEAPAEHQVWTWPLRWKGAPADTRRLGPDGPSLIFVGDMSDLFHEDRPFATIDRVINPIALSAHIGQLLTKRPAQMFRYFEDVQRTRRRMDFEFKQYRLRFWLGTSAERQNEFDERWPWLRSLAQLGFTVFISYEPAIGPLLLPDDFLALGNRAQVIAGGMSGRNADTPPHPQWFLDLRDQCAGAGVAFFFKQWGEFTPLRGEFIPVPPKNIGWVSRSGDAVFEATEKDFRRMGRDDDKHDTPWWSQTIRVGKKAAGRLLDGVTHDGYPKGVA